MEAVVDWAQGNPRLAGFVFAIVCGQILCHLIIPFTPFPKTFIKGAPDWTCYISMCEQLGVYWVLALLGWREGGFSWEWLAASADNVPTSGFYENLMLQALVFHLTKDLWDFRKLPLLFAHHLLCLFGIYTFYISPCGFGINILGVAGMEVGSGFYNIEMCKEGSITRLYALVMTLSTLGIVVLLPMWVYAAIQSNAHWSLIAFMIISNSILSFLRQRECVKHVLAELSVHKTKHKTSEKVSKKLR
eukprot:c32661_g1_i1.p1 GENE.c32661_g1_i1~~c32661_g1_i1.p1  ORF type:complete len:246 (+),score=42.83 c32661_g1_i1:39-776(+)